MVLTHVDLIEKLLHYNLAFLRSCIHYLLWFMAADGCKSALRPFDHIMDNRPISPTEEDSFYPERQPFEEEYRQQNWIRAQDMRFDPLCFDPNPAFPGDENFILTIVKAIRTPEWLCDLRIVHEPGQKVNIRSVRRPERYWHDRMQGVVTKSDVQYNIMGIMFSYYEVAVEVAPQIVRSMCFFPMFSEIWSLDEPTPTLTYKEAWSMFEEIASHYNTCSPYSADKAAVDFTPGARICFRLEKSELDSSLDRFPFEISFHSLSKAARKHCQGQIEKFLSQEELEKREGIEQWFHQQSNADTDGLWGNLEGFPNNSDENNENAQSNGEESDDEDGFESLAHETDGDESTRGVAAHDTLVFRAKFTATLLDR
ncbi:hypothetical protein EW146_g10375 [Bondarzewia mesenterica]|uniref:Uncharacterized protein n=1 Tax=Bondarzewia mesenterica TaxID=1095465 RepID=A0A4S4L2E6_9AGAM|nr:hypothetical protein EW146_g10375 [Bondarzewia mesenterica]